MLSKMGIRRNKRGEMGVGTMIIFIAMVLVAAVAASVLISTANTVREQAQSTGTDAINNVASGFVVYSVMGQVGASNTIDNCSLYVRLAAGSPSIDMSKVTILVTDGAQQTNYSYSSSAADSTHYKAELVGGANTVLKNNFIAQGDLVKITIGASNSELSWGTSTHVQIKIMPAHGMPTLSEFTTPETYLSTWITLR
ncbi:MAG TPA: archaellin/type IV pilin N-terminal domain-containing protein [Methanomassiliicoccales archaeon]|nr:archaellin/type IV pilin N-terminal domain-containing protein [Methanomassiliicoccales archaeon]